MLLSSILNDITEKSFSWLEIQDVCTVLLLAFVVTIVSCDCVDSESPSPESKEIRRCRHGASSANGGCQG